MGIVHAAVRIAAETFAAISFNSYRQAGQEKAPVESWLKLPFEGRKQYMEEAKHFINCLPIEDWPVDVKDYLREEGFFIEKQQGRW